jgi:hypothetical protein
MLNELHILQPIKGLFMKKLLLVLSLLSVSAFAQQYSNTVCRAQTPCFNYYGQYIGTAHCLVYGSTYVNDGSSDNSCNWSVMPNVGVSCAGYQLVQNEYGQTVWAWQELEVACPR